MVFGDELGAMLEGGGFVAVEIVLREETRQLINLWTADDKAGDSVVSARLTARKAA